jgi:hypothetical protein
MQLAPSIEDFTAAFAAGRNQVVWTRLVADLDTPVSLMLKLTGRARTRSCSRASPAARSAAATRSRA